MIIHCIKMNQALMIKERAYLKTVLLGGSIFIGISSDYKYMYHVNRGVPVCIRGLGGGYRLEDLIS